MQPGDRISHFEIEGLVGRGGMGVVYKARDINLDRTVALKFLPNYHRDDDQARARFELEAKAASALDHPNICSIYEIGETDDGALFIAMAYYDGESLEDRLRLGAMPLEEAVRVGCDVAAGLQAAHDEGIVHRDVKPGNIVLTRRDEVKILDFGLAKMQGIGLTAEGSTLGTANFMAPEQILGHEVDHRADIWALGAILYQMVSGRLPFSGEYEQAITYGVVHGQPSELSEAPDWMRAVVGRCLSKDPSDRYLTASEVADALQSPDSVAAPKPTSSNVAATASGVASRPRIATVAALVLVALVAAALLIRALGGPSAELPEARHIAVLPFANVGGDQANQAYVDGLVHAVSSKIASMERFQGALWVVPANDVFGKDVLTSDEAASQLHVNLAITGSVWVADEILQLTLNLVDAASGVTLRTAVLEEDRSRVLEIQDGVVRTAAKLIDLELRPDAEELLTAGATPVPGAYQFYLQGLGYLGRYESEDDVRQSITLFHRSITEDETFALGYAGLGEAFWRLYDITSLPADADSAIHHSTRALAQDGQLPQVQTTMGLVYSGTGRYDEAERAFMRALDLDPTSAETYVNLGKLYALTDRPVEAEEAYFRAIRLKPNRWDLYNTLGIFYFGRAEHEKAAEQFEQVTRLAPDNPWGYNNLAVQYLQTGQPERARPLYEKASTVNPAAADATSLAYYNLAYMSYADDDYVSAAESYEKALRYDPRDAESLMGLGTVNHLIGNGEAAREAWLKAAAVGRSNLEVNPRSQSALQLMAMTQAMLGHQDSAVVFVDGLLDLPSRPSSSYLAAGKAYEILGDRPAAITYVTRALDLGHSWESIESSAWLDDLREDPDFTRLVRNP